VLPLLQESEKKYTLTQIMIRSQDVGQPVLFEAPSLLWSIDNYFSNVNGHIAATLTIQAKSQSQFLPNLLV
jgi:hypothetical protein